MGRFVLGLAVAGIVWWGYDVYGGRGEPEPAPPSRMVDVPLVESSEVPVMVEGTRPEPPPTEPADPGLDIALNAGDPVAALIAELEVDDPGARGRVARALITLQGGARTRLSGVWIARVRTIESAADVVELFGSDNSYLRTEEGRGAARVAVERIASLPAAEAVMASTRLLEIGMQGPIESSDASERSMVDELYRRHRALVRNTLCDPANAAGARRYKVQAGDSLSAIASRFSRSLGVKIESGTLAAVNRITNPNALQAEQVLRIPVEELHTVITKRSFLMAVYLGPAILRMYWIAHGMEGHDTPEATFLVGAKVERPDWHYQGRIIPFGDPENPLGTHFVKFRHESYTGFGVHGTFDPRSIGTRASLGCIRLGKEDILEFFRIVPRGTRVEIRP